MMAQCTPKDLSKYVINKFAALNNAILVFTPTQRVFVLSCHIGDLRSNIVVALPFLGKFSNKARFRA
jgi:hypothetical protein